MKKQYRYSALLKSIGPGLIWAGAAVGVSHLIQSTRAGASFGFSFVWIVLAAMILKYPFFECGPRYAIATGNSLLHGYSKLGKWAEIIFILMTFGTMFAVVAAVTVVTAGLATIIFPWDFSPAVWSGILLFICVIILFLGRYPLLDSAVKVIIVLLTISTLAAVIIAGLHGDSIVPDFTPPDLWNFAGFSFMVALVGWMPSPIDVSVWHSLWTLERRKQTGHLPELKHARFDFNLGYIGTGFLAIGFLTLGALVMYGSGETFAKSGGKFAAQLINLYTTTLGNWSRPIILLAAFTTMFSTTLTVTDAYPRVLAGATQLLFPKITQIGTDIKLYWIWMFITVSGGLGILFFLPNTMTFWVDIATTLSFVVAPILAFMNYQVMISPSIPDGYRLPRYLVIWSWIGIIFLTGFAIVFLVWRFII